MFDCFPSHRQKGVMVIASDEQKYNSIHNQQQYEYKEVYVYGIHNHRDTPTITVSYIVKYVESSELINNATVDDNDGKIVMTPVYKTISYPIEGKIDLYPSITHSGIWCFTHNYNSNKHEQDVLIPPYVVFDQQADRIRQNGVVLPSCLNHTHHPSHSHSPPSPSAN